LEFTVQYAIKLHNSIIKNVLGYITPQYTITKNMLIDKN